MLGIARAGPHQSWDLGTLNLPWEYSIMNIELLSQGSALAGSWPGTGEAGSGIQALQQMTQTSQAGIKRYVTRQLAIFRFYSSVMTVQHLFSF